MSLLHSNKLLLAPAVVLQPSNPGDELLYMREHKPAVLSAPAGMHTPQCIDLFFKWQSYCSLIEVLHDDLLPSFFAYFLTHLLTYLLTYLRTYLRTYLLTYLLNLPAGCAYQQLHRLLMHTADTVITHALPTDALRQPQLHNSQPKLDQIKALTCASAEV